MTPQHLSSPVLLFWDHTQPTDRDGIYRSFPRSQEPVSHGWYYEIVQNHFTLSCESFHVENGIRKSIGKYFGAMEGAYKNHQISAVFQSQNCCHEHHAQIIAEGKAE